MPKIKDIHDRLIKNPVEYIEIRFSIAKRTLAFFLAFYYTIFLFTIGGFTFWPFDMAALSQIAFHTYTILVIMVAWFFYEFVVYAVHIYADDKRWIIIAALVLALIFGFLAIFTHFI
jgi:uncharacterized membrane protein